MENGDRLLPQIRMTPEPDPQALVRPSEHPWVSAGVWARVSPAPAPRRNDKTGKPNGVQGF